MMCGKEAVDLLLAKDMATAKACANQISEYNESRKELDKKVTEEAIAQVDSDPELAQKKSLLVFNPSWHKGVIGIVASRLTEHYYRPAIVLTSSGDGFASGSARSIQGVNVYNAINACRDLVETFGGHSFAAGLTLKETNIPEFSRRMEEYVEQHITPAQECQHLDIDLEISFSDINLRLFKGIRSLAPFGAGNMKPMFVCRGIKDNGSSRLVGKTLEHIRLELVDPVTGVEQNGIAFNAADRIDIVKSGEPFDIVFTIEENSYSPSTVQLLVRDIKRAADQSARSECPYTTDFKHEDALPESIQMVHA
jgi:single-stranded-DNA-specific exonuclease